MDILLSFIIAFLVGGALIVGIDALARHGALDSGEKWYRRGPAWIIVSHLVMLVMLWIIKSFQVEYKTSGFDPWCGFVQRLDDISWWTMIMGTVAGTAMIWYGGGLVFSGAAGRPVRAAWRVTAPVGLISYTVAVCIGQGTFFWNTDSAFVARLQCVEGAIVLSYIFTAYLFIACLVQVIRSRKPWSRTVTGFILAGGIAGMIGIASAVFGLAGADWAKCGYRHNTGYDNGRFWLFAGAVWWPWLVVFLVAVFVFSKRHSLSSTDEE